MSAPARSALSREALRRLVYASLMVALSVVLPYVFHLIPGLGTYLSPIHLPSLFCGLVCGPLYGALCGLAGPLLSSLITGMPGALYLPPMMVECAAYGLVAGLGMRWIRTGKTLPDILVSLLSAQLAGRLAAGAVRAFLLAADGFTFRVFLTSYFVSTWPAIVLQLVLLPMLYLLLVRVRLLPCRYPIKSTGKETRSCLPNF